VRASLLALPFENASFDAVTSFDVLYHAWVTDDRAYEEGFEDMQRRVPDLSKLHALTGYEPKVHLDEILDRVVAYFTSDASRL